MCLRRVFFLRSFLYSCIIYYIFSIVQIDDKSPIEFYGQKTVTEYFQRGIHKSKINDKITSYICVQNILTSVWLDVSCDLYEIFITLYNSSFNGITNF